MEKITSSAQLRASILKLEVQQAAEITEVKAELKNTFEKLKPINLIKNSVNDFLTSSNLKENLINAGLGAAIGYLSKKAAVGSTNNPLKQLLGSVLQVAVTGMVSKNADGIKSTAMQIIKMILSKKEKENV